MKKFRFILIALLFLCINQLIAQDDVKKDSAWTKGGDVSLVFSQVSLSNWSAGGENSLATNAFFNYFANYKKDSWIWDNKFEFAFGLQKQGEQSLRKSDDKLYFKTTAGKELKNHWYFTGSFDFKSQFAKGYNYPNDVDVISKLFAPAYITFATGFQYKKTDAFVFNVSPVAGKLTVVGDEDLSNAGAFGVTPGSKTKWELGASINLLIKKEIMKNVELKSNLDLFSAYTNNPEYIDVNWEVFINMKVNEYITTTFTTHLIYDHDIMIADENNVMEPRVQFKELFGVGISYNF